jgi:hypothetical protein
MHEFDTIDKSNVAKKRELMRGLYSKLNEGQKGKFRLIFPDGIDGISKEKLKSTFDLLKRTVLKNEEVLKKESAPLKTAEYSDDHMYSAVGSTQGVKP